MRAARALALVIAVVVSASLLAGLSYLVPSLFHRGRIIIRAYAMGGDGDPTQLTNASFSVWAWAPAPNGTEFIPVFNGTGAQAVIDLSRLVSWAEDWIHAYGRAAIRSFEPSIIMWVSYPIALPNGSVELLTQPSFQPLNLSLPLSGNGTIAVNVMVNHPFRTLLKANGKGAGIAVRGLGEASPEQGTVTVPITTSFTYCGMPCYLVPHVMFWYPNDTGTAPISLAVALGQPSSVGGADVVISITEFSQVVNQSVINGLMTPGSAVEAATGEYEETGNLPQVLSQFSVELETTFTFTSEGEVQEGNSIEAYVPWNKEPDIGQLYIVGQAALVNWTLQSPSGATVGWYLGLQLTEVEVVGIDNVEVPVIYNWWAYDPCVNLNEWAYEQQVLMQDPGDFYSSEINYSCPLPNTPAPVIWQYYATNLTYFDIVNPYQVSYASYVDLSVGVNGAKSPLGIAIDLGSAIVKSAEPVVSLASSEVGDILKVIGALLGSFQYQSNSVAVSVNTITISNPYTNYYVNVYYSGLTPVYYTVGGQSFTLPRELILINVTS
ncbi:hypothetical protein [Acidilobus sp. 7A]|uniref:hypothetical protein n=1 Tax=Acidilobus sp. 7A TaxID=1577685 RepID=UPI000764D1C5|nr:hypothetical protein [Acidilobus sp. 7A]AMD30669.1 hypothetical protein SE86_04350 [Acidilobus sp. 7A]